MIINNSVYFAYLFPLFFKPRVYVYEYFISYFLFVFFARKKRYEDK